MARPKPDRGHGQEDEALRRPLDRLLRRKDTPASDLARVRKPVGARRPAASGPGESMEKEAKRRPLDSKLRQRKSGEKTPPREAPRPKRPR